MDPRHKEILRKHRLDLSDQILIEDTIVQFLYQENILTESQVDEIQSQISNKKKTLRLLDILPTRGPRAFGTFLNSLEEEFTWVRDKLLQDLEQPNVPVQSPTGFCIPNTGKPRTFQNRVTQTRLPVDVGEWIKLKVQKRKWNHPRWMGPYQVITATPTAVKVQERQGWHHLSHLQKTSQPS
uniref:death domain-containing protein CRADD isoform X2 n=1 Tax=Oncorhynchus gorbuscha TaxID=8017 RepID=UPI001EAEBEED|nr:death domain-containing protein CRADD isoform X2 [Oncorhynchus gorbuscha]